MLCQYPLVLLKQRHQRRQVLGTQFLQWCVSQLFGDSEAHSQHRIPDQGAQHQVTLLGWQGSAGPHGTAAHQAVR